MGFPKLFVSVYLVAASRASSFKLPDGVTPESLRVNAGPYECNFLTDPSVSCMLPWPDNFFYSRTWNPNAPLGLTLTNASLPVDSSGDAIDPVAGGYNDLQGFSPLGPFLAYLPGLNMDLSGLPRLWNISASTTVSPQAANSALLGIDTVTGAVTPYMHFVELDHSGDDDGSNLYERAAIIWPASRLNDSTRYIVAFRNLVDDDGIPVTSSDGFTALRDKITTGNPALEASRTRFESIFSTLEAAGWTRSSLVLAWDFTTQTQEDLTSRFISMRDDAFARIAALPNGVQYNITQITDNPASNTSRRITGQFYVPCYLPDRAVPSLTSKLVLDPTTKLPVFQEFVPFNFEVVIPTSVTQPGAKPAKVVQYGHGLFGDLSEVEGGYLADEGTEYGYVYGASDWIGLSEYDEPTVVVMIAKSFTDFGIVPDRLHQGMLNALVLMKMLTQSAFTKDPAVTYNNQSVISTNPDDWHYTGNSQGGIMGGVYMAATTDVSRGVLGVAGGPYAVLLPRSTDFSTLFDLLRIKFPRSMDRMAALAIIQALWDRMDPSGWVSYVPTGGNLPNTPSHRAIWHYGLGDAQVSWLGCHAVALSAGAVMFESNVHEGNETLTQFTQVSDTAVLTTGSAIMGFDYGLPQVPFVNIPPNDGYDAHECPRRTPQAQAQMAHFFETGEIINTCNGACVVSIPDNCAH